MMCIWCMAFGACDMGTLILRRLQHAIGVVIVEHGKLFFL